MMKKWDTNFLILCLVAILLFDSFILLFVGFPQFRKVEQSEGSEREIKRPSAFRDNRDWPSWLLQPLQTRGGRKTVAWPSEGELQQWWARQLLVKEIATDHIERAFFPLDLSDSTTWTQSTPLGANYTRAWRRDSMLRLLSAWAVFCTTLELDYWLDAGSLLGRARSEGKSLIPWDFDADVGMLRSEFQKLNKSLNEGGRAGLSQAPDFGLPDGIVVFTRQSPPEGMYKQVVVRDDVIPGRIIDITTGFYVDIFGIFSIRKDGGVQMFWPHGGPNHYCLGFDEKKERAADRRSAAEIKIIADMSNDPMLKDFVHDHYSDAYSQEDCEGPCEGNKMCYIWDAHAVLPTVPCLLHGVPDFLQCPRSEAQYLEEQYGTGWAKPDRVWDAGEQDFVKE